MIGVIQAGETNEEERGLVVVIRDTTTGDGVAGLETADVTARLYAKRPGQAATWGASAGTLAEVDGANAPGVYLWRLAAAEVASVRQGFVVVTATGAASEPVAYSVGLVDPLGGAISSEDVADALDAQGYTPSLATSLLVAAIHGGAPGTAEVTLDERDAETGVRTTVYTVSDADDQPIGTSTITRDAGGAITTIVNEAT